MPHHHHPRSSVCCACQSAKKQQPLSLHTTTMLPTTITKPVPRKRNGHFSMKSASNFVLALLVLHWCYMISQMFAGHDAHSNNNDKLMPDETLPDETLLPHEPYPFEFTWKWHPQNRSDRFPSVQERVKLYMGNWYLPPCDSKNLLRHVMEKVDKWNHVFISDATNNHTFELDSIVDADVMFLFDRDSIRDCARTIPEIEQEGKLYTEDRVKKRINLQSYCSEVVGLIDYMNGLDYFTPKASRQATPIIGQFGDNHAGPTTPLIPVIAKWRAATTPFKLHQVTDSTCVQGERPPLNITHPMYEGISPIIWMLEMCRHWDPLEFARQEDTKWEHKKLGALWRGDLTGRHMHQLTDEQVCFGNQRCRFVFNHRDSKYIDAGLSDGLNWLSSGNISGVPIIKGRVTMQQIQQYKVIISFEGNDVASGLKWSLLSESVVLMPEPTRTSWAMEELLEPWVHYIPMYPNGSNAEEMIRWVGDNDEKAKRIAERGRLFMYDMLYHPDAAKDEREVKAEIARRYRNLWL